MQTFSEMGLTKLCQVDVLVSLFPGVPKFLSEFSALWTRLAISQLPGNCWCVDRASCSPSHVLLAPIQLLSQSWVYCSNKGIYCPGKVGSSTGKAAVKCLMRASEKCWILLESSRKIPESIRNSSRRQMEKARESSREILNIGEWIARKQMMNS